MVVTKEKMDRRSASRLPVSVEMEGRRNGDVFEGTCVNVSETGILIQTNKSLNLGDRITIRLITPGQEEIVGGGRVIRYDDFGFGKFGYAVHWELDVSQKTALREWMNARNK
jgi:hypothetical protein